ncbi:MAG: hypothetical protein OXS29_04055 [bacterium]|nr:hypothetical protein [bacterium]MDE0290669.1 hypothetical protein [bacterium]MDE0439122.1 hypothetical protein [bacterium]
MLEDTVTKEGTLLEAIGVAESESLHIVQVLVLADGSRGEAGRLISAQGIPYTAVLTPEDLGLSEDRPGSPA